MISSLEDTLILLLVALLLFGGDKKALESVKSLGKMWGELKKRQEELKQELIRELNETSEPFNQVKREILYDPPPTVRPYQRTTGINSPLNNEERIRKLEEEIRRLQAELERLKKNDGKN
jgi:sec-independent protein translocase protein TatA